MKIKIHRDDIDNYAYKYKQPRSKNNNEAWILNSTVVSYGSREGTIQKYFANPTKYFKSQYYSQITVEKFDKSKKLLQILRKFVDPQITFSI